MAEDEGKNDQEESDFICETEVPGYISLAQNRLPVTPEAIWRTESGQC